MTATYTPLGTVTLTGADTSVEFASIPNTFRDIVAVIIGTASSTQGGRMVLNADSANSYSTVRMYGVGSGSGASDAFGGTFGYIGDVFTSHTQIVIQLMDYSATNKHKTWLYRMDNAANYTMAGAGRYASNTAVSNIRFQLNGGASYAIGTTISLYGIA